MHILITDPSATRRRMLRTPLDRTVGAAIEEATTGRDALRIAETLRDVLVITGPELDGMSAASFATVLRRLPGHAATPLLLVTPPCSHDEFLDAVDAGYEDCVIVPFEDAVLLDKVERALELLRQRSRAPQRYRRLDVLRNTTPDPKK